MRLNAMLAIVLAIAPAFAAAAPAPAQVESGRRLFQRCVGCHAVGPHAGNIYGPQLNGVVGRKAGSVPGYAYSAAMNKANLVWNERTLAAFIRDSDKVVPGNRMRFLNFLSEQQARDIVAYLATQGGPVRAAPAR